MQTHWRLVVCVSQDLVVALVVQGLDLVEAMAAQVDFLLLLEQEEAHVGLPQDLLARVEQELRE